MESLSRPFHSRKLSNATTFSNKTPYDGVFSGHRRKFAGAPPVDLQDYREIFSSSQASSIPILDLSTFREPSDALSFDFRGLKPDYSKIFGGFRDEDVAVSYDEAFARDKLRVPSSTAPTSQDGDNLSHQSPDALKQFNMSYNKINLKFKDGLDGTKHVTQLPAVTGFTCFVDEPVMEAAKKKPLTVNVSVDVPRKQPSGNVVKKQSNPVESIAEDTTSTKSRTFDVDFKKNASTVSSSPTNDKSRTFDVDFKKYASTVSSSPTNDKSGTFDVDFKKNASTVYSSPINAKSRTFDVDFKRNASTVSSSPTNVVNHNNNNPRKSINSESFKTDFNDELDVNAAASASSEALKKAIEKAQESIRIAKESVGRKKKGLRSFSSKKFKNSLKDEGSVEDVTAGEEKKRRDEDSSPLMQDAGRSHKHGGVLLFPSFMDGEKLFVAKKFIDEMHEKISESNKDNKFGDNNATQVTSGPEFKRLDSDGKDEYATSSSEAVDTETSKNQSSDFAHEYQAENRYRDEYEARIKVSQATNDVLEHQSVVNEQESEKIHDEVRLSNAHEMVEELNNLNVSQEEKDDKEVSKDFNQSDDEKRFDASLELLENEKQENVLEHEDGENAASEKHEEIEQASELVRSENESKHDQNTGFQKAEETTEIFDDFCERDANDSVQTSDNSLEESNLSAETCDNKLEDSEVNLHDDCELKHDDRYSDERKEESLDESRDQELKHDDRYSSDERKEESLDESRDQEFDEKSSGDDNVMKETDDMDRIHVASNVVEMNDINVETTQEVDDVTEVSCEYQAEEAEFCEKTFIDQTASDENEDEHILKSEENDIIDNLADLGSENDVQSESSSGSPHGVKRIQEESNTQPPHKEIPDTETANEIKDSQESVSRQKQDEIEEPGPSKVSGKERFRKIDEEAAAKEREWEKNRLAVERAIREARERAFAEARERAERERAAVEKATEEVRQRMMAEAHEKVSKASATKKSSSERTITQSKLRAERAAVERATSEARQRALEKAISQKTVSELNRSESALRTKAKLEKHNRIMERAAKALAEKEKRDRLAQKEQAERNRLAENLDADIKRWSNGKEGNLRALISTLQYILGPESGWQPVSLTEIVTTSAVKKAYRKATLCVHPDKLQQRGATIQQKYICEKVFDLLKAAWNRFNSEER